MPPCIPVVETVEAVSDYGLNAYDHVNRWRPTGHYTIAPPSTWRPSPLETRRIRHENLELEVKLLNPDLAFDMFGFCYERDHLGLWHDMRLGHVWVTVPSPK